MLSEDLPARNLSEVSGMCFEYTAQFEGTFYERFYFKEIASLSLTVVLRYLPFVMFVMFLSRLS